MRTKTPRQAEKILEAATKLFGTQRFHEVRMEDIALEAKVGKGTLYRYFKDKEELYLALLVRASEVFIKQLLRVTSAGKPARECLVACVDFIIDHFDRNPHLIDLIQRAEVMHDAGVDFPWKETRDRLPEIIKGIFDEGSNSGQFFVADSDLTVRLLLGGIRSVIRFGENPREPDLAEKIIDYFLAGADRPMHAGINASQLESRSPRSPLIN